MVLGLSCSEGGDSHSWKKEKVSLRMNFGCVCVRTQEPDLPCHKFRASRSEDQLFLCSSGTSCDFQALKL